jgi:WD40 repeat protein
MRKYVILILLFLLMDQFNAVSSQENDGHPVITPENAAQVTQLAMLGHGTMTDVAWSPHGDVLAIGSTVGIWLYDANNLEAEPDFIATPGKQVTTLAFCPDGLYLVTGHMDWNARVWDVTSRQLITMLDFAWTDRISDIAFSPDGQLLAVADQSTRFGLFETMTWSELNQLSGGNTVAFSGNGEQIAIGGQSEVYIWRTEDALAIDINASEQVLAPMHSFVLESPIKDRPSAPYLFDMVFDPTSSVLFVSGRHGSEAGVVQAWDTSTGEFLAHFSGHLYGVNGLAVTQDGSTLISVGFDMRLWDVKHGLALNDGSENEALAVLPATNPQRYFAAQRRLLTVTRSPDNHRFATISADNYLQIWDIETGDYSEHKFSGSELTDLVFSEDGSWLLTYGGSGYTGIDGSIAVWDTETWTATYTAFLGYDGDWTTTYQGVAINGKNNLLVYPIYRLKGDIDEQITENDLRIVDLTTGEDIATLAPVSEDIAFSSPTFTPDGTILLMFEGPRLLGFDVQTLLNAETIDPHDALLQINLDIWNAQYEISPDGNDLLILNDEQLEWHSLSDGALLAATNVPWNRLSATCFGNNQILAAGVEEPGDIIVVVDAKSGEIQEFPSPISEQNGLFFTSDCTMLASGSPGSGYSDGGSIYLWNVNDGQRIAAFAPENTSDVEGIQFNPDGTLLAFSNIVDGRISERYATLRLWDVETQTELVTLQDTGWVSQIQFSPDGSFIATASSYEGDGVIRIWGVPQPNNVPEYRPLTTIPREPFLVQIGPEYFAFSPDGTQIAAAATRDAVNVWDVATGSVIYTLDHPRSTTTWSAIPVSWSPDGTTITTGNTDWTLRFWDAATGQLRSESDDAIGWHVGWSPDSTRFVTNGMIIFDAATSELVMELGYNWGVPYETEWSPDGTMIATASGWEGDDTQLWTATGEHLDSFQTGHSIAWSPDSTRLASIGQIRDVATGLPVVIFPAMGGEIGWHPDGEWIANTGEEAVFLWDATTGDQLAKWDLPGCDIRGFAWSNDGNRFAVNCLGDMSQPGFRNELIIWERVR